MSALRCRDDERIYEPLSASRRIEALVMEHRGPETLRAFTVRIMTEMPEGSVPSLLDLARRHGWFGFEGDPKTTDYRTLIFVNRAAP